MWSYILSNWASLDLNEKCPSPLPPSDGLRWRWCQTFYDEASKVGNSVNSNSASFMQKPTFFSCVHTQSLLNRFLLRIYNISFKIKSSQVNLKPPKTLAKPYKIEISIRKGDGKERREEKRKKISIRNTSVEVQEPKQKIS